MGGKLEFSEISAALRYGILISSFAPLKPSNLSSDKNNLK